MCLQEQDRRNSAPRLFPAVHESICSLCFARRTKLSLRSTLKSACLRGQGSWLSNRDHSARGPAPIVLLQTNRRLEPKKETDSALHVGVAWRGLNVQLRPCGSAGARCSHRARSGGRGAGHEASSPTTVAPTRASSTSSTATATTGATRRRLQAARAGSHQSAARTLTRTSLGAAARTATMCRHLRRPREKSRSVCARPLRDANAPDVARPRRARFAIAIARLSLPQE